MNLLENYSKLKNVDGFKTLFIECMVDYMIFINLTIFDQIRCVLFELFFVMFSS